MALIVNGTLTVNTASTLLTFSDITGNYNASTNPNGYGGINRAVADNVGTHFVFVYPDATTNTVSVDGTTVPPTDFVPFGGLTRTFTLSDLSQTSATMPTGVIQLTYRPYFTTASAGDVGVTNGLPTVTRASGQDFTSDFADSSVIVLAGVKYTIASKTTTTITLSENYAGLTDAALEAYIGYEALIPVLTPYEFLTCWEPLWIAMRFNGNTCNDPKYQTLRRLYDIYLQVQAKQTALDYNGANQLLIDLVDLCECAESGSGGCC